MSRRFWIEDISQLFAFNEGIFPNSSLNLIDNMNATARLALLACIILALFKPVLATGTFIIATIITISIYYGISAKEKFDEITQVVPSLPKWYSESNATSGASPGSYASGLAGDLFTATPKFNSLTASEFCTNKRRIPDDPAEYVSENQMLVGGPNPKTLIPVMNALKTKSHDLSVWKSSDFTVHSGINSGNSAFDAHTSGYVSQYTNERPRCKECFKTACTCMQYAAAKQKLANNRKFYNVVNDIDINDIDDDLPEIEIIEKSTPASTDIIDPRFSGYGPTDRCYRDEITGQTKYFYDDVNSITMPPYISRNNIDIYPWAPKCGFGYDGSTSNVKSEPVHVASAYKGLNQLKQNALDEFRNSTNNARKELQESLMKKRNGEMWQLRVAPIY